MTKFFLPLLLISVFTFTGCDDTVYPAGSSGSIAGDPNANNNNGNPNNTTPSASAIVLGNKITFTNLSAELSSSPNIIRLETPVGEIVGFQLEEPIQEGSFPISNYNTGYYIEEGGANVFTSTNSSNAGVLTVTEVNLVDNYISGTFSFSACMGANIDCLTVESGTFTRVSIK